MLIVVFFNLNKKKNTTHTKKVEVINYGQYKKFKNGPNGF